MDRYLNQYSLKTMLNNQKEGTIDVSEGADHIIEYKGITERSTPVEISNFISTKLVEFIEKNLKQPVTTFSE